MLDQPYISTDPVEIFSEQVLQLEEFIKSTSVTEKIILNVKEAARYIGVSVPQVYALIAKNAIPCSNPSIKGKYFTIDDLDSWLLNTNRVSSIFEQREEFNKTRLNVSSLLR